MKAHDLLYNINKINIKYDDKVCENEDVGVACNWARGLIEKSAKFLFDKDVFEKISTDKNLLSTALCFINNDVFTFPNDITILQFNLDGNVFISIIEKGNDDILFTACGFLFINNKWHLATSLFTFLKDMRILVKKGREEVLQNYCSSYSNLIFQSIIAIQSKGIEIQKIEQDKKLNDSRIKKGKLPLYEYKKLILNGKTSRILVSKGGTHSSPRMHFRRGHVRTLPTGKKTPVQACVVGKREDGIIEKDYEVRYN